MEFYSEKMFGGITQSSSWCSIYWFLRFGKISILVKHFGTMTSMNVWDLFIPPFKLLTVSSLFCHKNSIGTFVSFVFFEARISNK